MRKNHRGILKSSWAIGQRFLWFIIEALCSNASKYNLMIFTKYVHYFHLQKVVNGKKLPIHIGITQYNWQYRFSTDDGLVAWLFFPGWVLAQAVAGEWRGVWLQTIARQRCCSAWRWSQPQRRGSGRGTAATVCPAELSNCDINVFTLTHTVSIRRKDIHSILAPSSERVF